MKNAILFWFYKSKHICRSRLRHLRRHNPRTPIFGLYGGDPQQAAAYERALGPYLDDFYAHPSPKARWKWRNGDLMIADWYSARGRELDWDNVVIVQWDMLMFGAVEKLFPELDGRRLLLSGLRPVSEVVDWWPWVLRDDVGGQEFERFLAHVRDRYGYADEPLCCLFIVACFPRTFLERFAEIEERELGFLEYRVPIYAQIFGNGFVHDHSYKPWWAVNPATRRVPARERTLSARPRSYPPWTLVSELRRPGGQRVFHPYRLPSPAALDRLLPEEERRPPPDR